MQRRHDTPFFATLSGALDQLRARPPRLDDAVRADGERILVTGATRGLGRAVARELARRGATPVIVGRSGLDAAKAAMEAPDAEAHAVDLTDPAAVEAFLDGVGALDRVVLNAGGVSARSRRTAAGLDRMVHLHLVANAQLVAGLRRRGRLRKGARVVVVGSESHRFAAHLADWQTPTDYGTAGVLEVYGQSKRLLHTWAEALALDAPELDVVHLCPGGVASDIAREAPAALRWAVDPAMRLLFPSPARAAVPVAWAVLDPSLSGRSGVYLHLGVEKDPGEGVRDVGRGRRLFDETRALIAQWER
jgi:NAD(P)-dependent dehydrogenase (short-subunit alcohol dehydrogenase family)